MYAREEKREGVQFWEGEFGNFDIERILVGVRFIADRGNWEMLEVENERLLGECS